MPKKNNNASTKHSTALRGLGFVALTCLWAFLSVAAAAVPKVHILKVDLKAMIRAGARSPTQFAVPIPHTATLAKDGTWSNENGIAVWRYGVKVPTAISLSFHAGEISLPKGAVLTVRGVRSTTSYRALDTHLGQLWSRIQPGDALEFELTVPLEARSQVSLVLTSLQAGYRSIGDGVADHPYYAALKSAQAESADSTACITNYKCAISASNTPVGAATAALTIQNIYQCTGTLINDVPGDNTPYMLTARHCESGKLGGGDPGAASSVTVYWDAVSACGSTLGSLYDPGIQTQTGAQTIVEQQDAWLIELDSNPVVTDAQFAGFDASGSAVQGGYTVHHAEGYDKQFVAWFGAAASLQQHDVLGTTYTSNFWETVNSTGNIGPGASGSGLINQNNRLVGSLSLGRTTSDPSGYGSCPATSPPAPNGANGIADFTSLAAVWSSTADSTSTTGTATLKSVLDPANTGTLTVASAPVLSLSFGGPETMTIGVGALLSWTATGATQCIASGGNAGDGWSGSVGAVGALSVTETAPGLVTYTLQCSYSGGRKAKSNTTVSWLGPTPSVQLSGPNIVWTSAPATFTWTSNVSPCTLTGGGFSATNLPASGSVTTTQATAGLVNYNMTCGSANQSASYPAIVQYVTPSLVLSANGLDRRMGESFFLIWDTAATVCTPSGGAPNDGWSNTQYVGFSAYSGEPVYPSVTIPGTYTYTLTCTAGAASVAKSVTVKFENDPPYADLTLGQSTVTFSNSPADWVDVSWNTNLSGCGFDTSPNASLSYNNPSFAFVQGTASLVPSQSGTVQITLTCSPIAGQGTSASATVTVLPAPPPVVTIAFSPSNPVVGESFEASWSATNSGTCLLTGGIPNELWGESIQSLPSSGYQDESAPAAGQYTFIATCQSIDPSVAAVTGQATVTIGAAKGVTATLSVSPASVSVGDTFTLTWSSTGAADCTGGTGGAENNPWTGTPLSVSGAVAETAVSSGTYTYTVDCMNGAAHATGTATLTVSAAASTSGGSGGGGGAEDALGLGILTVLSALRAIRGRPGGSRRAG